MKTVIDLLEAVKTAKNVDSDYALAKELDIPKQRISEYYNGKSIPDAYASMQIARALGKTLDEITSVIKMETEKDEKRRNAWREYYKSIGGIAASIALVFLFVVTLIVTPSPIEAAPLLSSGEYAICIMLSYVVVQIAKRSCAAYAFQRISACGFRGLER